VDYEKFNLNLGNGVHKGGSVMNNGTNMWPNVPVIFVLGGPGSGKISHSERLASHNGGSGGLIHINSVDLLRQAFGLQGTNYCNCML
jgi:hypothetical protein